jgi:thymidylate synthase ThyX
MSEKINVELLLATRGYSNHTNGLITFLCEIPYYVLAEITRHKRFVYNVSSARAQSSNRHINHGYYIPEIFYKDQPGMQSSDDEIEEQERAREIYENVWNYCSQAVESLNLLGVAKEQANRLLPTNKMIKMVITGTEDAYQKMFNLRTAKNADKAMQVFAISMLEEYNHILETDMWRYSSEHIPMILPDEKFNTREEKILTSMARIARTSYDKPQKGKNDIELGKRLIREYHWSPSEHIAFYSQEYRPSALCSKPDDIYNRWSWSNYRSIIE